MVVPIQALRAGAARIGAGDLGQRIDIKTGDEVEALANQFNDMAGRLQESYADLEKKVDDRTRELTESLAQQTATSEVLRSIASSRGELEPIFNIILASANRLCDATYGTMYLREDDGYRAAARQGHLPASAEQMWWRGDVFQPRPDVPFGRAVSSGRPVLVADLATEPAYLDRDPWMVAGVDLAGIRSMCAIPMMKDDALVGVVAFYRREVRPFTEKQIALVQSFAAQAVIAIENARLLSELRESLDRQTATADVLRVISSSPGDLEPVFNAMLENAARICDAKAGNIYRWDGEALRLAASHNTPPAFVEVILRSPIRPTVNNPVGHMLRAKSPIHVADLAAQPQYIEKIDPSIVAAVDHGGVRTLLTVPMVKENEFIGAFTLWRQEVRPFADKQIDLVKNFAAQAVIAIENTRLLHELRQRTDDLSASLEELRTAQDRLVQTEKLASLGQLTAGIAHEIKNPLNFVNNFSTLSVELIDELQEELAKVKIDDAARDEIAELADTLKGNLEKIAQHGKRADSIVKNMLLHSREGSGEHRPVDVNGLVEESLNLAYHGARAEKQGFNITLERAFDPAAGEVDLYPQEVTRVLLNLISNGFYAATKRKAQADGESFEPTLAASTKNLGDRVEIRIRDNGTGIPPEVKEKMFNPFFTTKPAGEGTGLGLSISHDIIVKQHAGTIAVDTEPGKFTEFTIVLPRKAAALEKTTGGRA